MVIVHDGMMTENYRMERKNMTDNNNGAAGTGGRGMIDATRFRELWEAYCTHSANLKSAEEAGAQLDIDYIEEEEARVLLASFLLSHAAELLALVDTSTGKPTLIDGDERTTVRIGDFKLCCEGRAPGKVWIEAEGGEGGDFPIADIEALIREYYDANF